MSFSATSTERGLNEPTRTCRDLPALSVTQQVVGCSDPASSRELSDTLRPPYETISPSVYLNFSVSFFDSLLNRFARLYRERLSDCMALYGGRKVSLNSLELAGSEHPTTCWVTDKAGKSLHVRVGSLRPLSVDVAEKLMPKGDDWNAVGKFVVFDSPDALSGGVVTEAASSGSIRIHGWMPVLCKTGVIWAPVWTDEANENPARYLKCPNKHQPHLITVQTSDIICACDLAARKLTTAAVSLLENLGYDQFSAP